MSMRLPRAAIARVPDGTRIVSVERMSRAFTKYHLDDGRALHRFKMEKPHATPHDHPWSFDTKILDGGYVEDPPTIAECGLIDRNCSASSMGDAGSSYYIPTACLSEWVDRDRYPGTTPPASNAPISTDKRADTFSFRVSVAVLP